MTYDINAILRALWGSGLDDAKVECWADPLQPVYVYIGHADFRITRRTRGVYALEVASGVFSHWRWLGEFPICDEAAKAIAAYVRRDLRGSGPQRRMYNDTTL